jgi:hypothetical protein
MKACSNKFALVAAAMSVMLVVAVQTATAQDKPSPPPAPPADAAAAPVVPKMKTACGTDLASFCPDQKGAEARKCLRSHRAELSPSCVAYFKARRAAAKAKAMAEPAPGSPSPAAPPKQ